MDSSGPYASVQTTSPVISLEAFHGILWTAFAFCLVAFALRLYIRYHCFRRLLIDDWVMMFALALLLSVVVLAQIFLADVYKVIEVVNGHVIPDATFPDTMRHGQLGFGAALTVSLFGILAVKINFLLFFKRLGTRITSYLIFWYFMLFITVACGATTGLMDYKCIFGSLEYTMRNCTHGSNNNKRYFDVQKISVVLDVISDVLIICFPIVILWNVRVSLRKKLILSCTFGLVALTIAVTIVRGSISGGIYKMFDQNNIQNLNIGWMWFWSSFEFAVGFLTACIISFRALFAQREKKAYENQAQLQQLAWQERQASSSSKRKKSSGILRQARHIHDSLLQSFKTLETVHDMGLPEPESGRFSPTFLTEIENVHITKERTNSLGDSVDRH